jgi:hypothetical protein
MSAADDSADLDAAFVEEELKRLEPLGWSAPQILLSGSSAVLWGNPIRRGPTWHIRMTRSPEGGPERLVADPHRIHRPKLGTIPRRN